MILILKLLLTSFLVIGGIFAIMAVSVSGTKAAPYLLIGIIAIELMVLIRLFYKEFRK